jgi:tetratricopeptide (TPR) repeat protein
MEIMDNLEYIDDYFKNNAPEQKQEFEKRIVEDPAFAEDVSFYMSAQQVAQNEWNEESKIRFREIYKKQHQAVSQKTPVRSLWIYAAAAMVIGVTFGIYIFLKPGESPKLMADRYINEQLKTLPVTMGNKESELQKGLQLYNEEKFTEALALFEHVIKTDTSDFTSKKYAGIVSLRLKQYDKAITYFTALKNYTSLYSNAAVFYLALTLMERNQPSDAEQAKQLLQDVVQNNLEGKEVAQEWLKKL